MQKYIFLSCFVLFFTISCSKSQPSQYGLKFNETIPLKPISAIFGIDNINGQIFSFKGRIESQCHDDGCWFKLKDDTGTILVDLKPYNFTLPMGLSGKHAVLNGRVNTSQSAPKIDAISVIVSD